MTGFPQPAKDLNAIHTGDAAGGLLAGTYPSPTGSAGELLAAVGTVVLGSGVAGDTFARFTWTADGTLSWGGGAGATDASIARNGLSALLLTGLLAATQDMRQRAGAATQTAIGAVGPGATSGVTFQNGEAGANLYRSAAGTIKTDGQLNVAQDLFVEQGSASQVKVGNAGPAAQSGISFQTGEAGANLYRSGAGTLKCDGTLNLPGTLQVLTVADATSGFTVMKAAGAGQAQLGFFGTGAINRPATIVAPIATASTNVAPFGYATAAQADAIVTAVRALAAGLIAATGLGLFA